MSKKKHRKHKTVQKMPNIQSNPSQVVNPQSSGSSQASSEKERTELLQLIKELENARGTRVINYWVTDGARISAAVVPSLYDQLSKIGKQKSIDLFVFTRGGDTEAPLRIVTLVREFCEHFSILVPYRAHSSGTLLAMGADEIIMTPLGVLSPIDPSRTHPLLPRREGAQEAEPISVQDMRHAMQFIMETAKPGDNQPYTAEAMAQIVIALFDKIHPLAIGAIEQSYALAKLIGLKCLSTHMDPATNKDDIKRIVDKLCDDYKSHSYEINRHEAREIGLKAVDATDDVDAAMMNLLTFYTSREFGGPSSPPKKGDKFKVYIAWLDSANVQMRAEAEMEMIDGGKTRTLTDRWVTY